ncbi:MAG: hypothetical protein M5U34_26090 [Chloroflexi bacterium]|nr:hypothetical protein [Chloroflexota bacterium]
MWQRPNGPGSHPGHSYPPYRPCWQEKPCPQKRPFPCPLNCHHQRPFFPPPPANQTYRPPTPFARSHPTANGRSPHINGIPIAQIVVLPPAVRQNVRAIFANGQTQGRSATTFSKLGDSTSMNPNFMGRFDDPANVNLGEFAYLQPTIDQFSGHFSRYGVSSRNGLHSWSVFDPLWADKEWCEPNEDVLNCEFRLNNPSIIFVRLGSNDAGAPPATATT